MINEPEWLYLCHYQTYKNKKHYEATLWTSVYQKISCLDEGDKLIEKCKLLKLTLEESKNKCIKTKEVDFIILKFPQRKIQIQMALLMTLTKKLKNLHKSFTNSSPKIAKKKIFSNLLCKASINPIPKLDKEKKTTDQYILWLKI